jgi:hypothetical protein
VRGARDAPAAPIVSANWLVDPVGLERQSGDCFDSNPDSFLTGFCHLFDT